MSGTVQNNVICVRQGDSFAINLEIKEGNMPVDLTQAQLLMQVKDENKAVKFSVLGTPVDAACGKMALLLTPMQTGIDVGDYSTDIQLTLADGAVHTIWPANVNQIGIFRITEQVTEA